jgi:hypothetical protein
MHLHRIMEPAASLRARKEPLPVCYEPTESDPQPTPHQYKINFCSVHPSTFMSSSWFLPAGFRDRMFCSCHMAAASRVISSVLVIVHGSHGEEQNRRSSPLCHCLQYRTTSPLHPLCTRPQPVSFPQYEKGQVSQPYKTTGKFPFLCISMPYTLILQTGDGKTGSG